MIKIKKTNRGYRGFIYESHVWHTGLKTIGGTTGRWIPKVVANEHGFVLGWLNNLVNDYKEFTPDKLG